MNSPQRITAAGSHQGKLSLFTLLFLSNCFQFRQNCGCAQLASGCGGAATELALITTTRSIPSNSLLPPNASEILLRANWRSLPPCASYKPSLMYKGPLGERYILHNLGVDPVKLAFEMALSARKENHISITPPIPELLHLFTDTSHLPSKAHSSWEKVKLCEVIKYVQELKGLI